MFYCVLTREGTVEDILDINDEKYVKQLAAKSF